MHTRYSITICFALVLLFLDALSQNLVPNPSFETYTSCPTGFSDLDQAEPWISPTDATPDYFNACAFNWTVDVPNNYWGAQDAHTGVAYAGLWGRWGPPANQWFEYIQAPLNSPMEFGKGYHVQFWVSLPGKYCGLDRLGAYISTGAVLQDGADPILFTPQIESNMGFLNDTLNWMLIEGCYVAEGGEDHITIGNFHEYDDTNIENCGAPYPFSVQTYYWVDDVSVQKVPLTGLLVDLPDDITVCYEYTIEPDAPPDVHYLWSTGSTEPTLTVTESGLYKLTIYDDQCNGGKDSIEVTIMNQPDVAINPEDTVICPGEVIVISLNPLAGDYEWNDGSDDATYTISGAGTYSVTLDDGCDLSEDEIEVEVLDPPGYFSLGSDSILCTGTEIEFMFDPSLGEFTWQDGSHESNILIYQEGTYALTISNMCGEFTDEVEIEELNSPQVNLGPSQDILCTGEFLDISLDPTYAEYEWQDGSHDPDYHITDAGLYSVTMTHICGISSDSILIQQLVTPAFELGDTLHACPGDSVYLVVPGIMGNYTWQNGSTNDSLLVTTPETYALTIENACGSDQDSIAIEYGDLLVRPDLGPDFSLCPGEQAVLYAGNPTADIVWQDGSTADSLMVNTSVVYYVLVTNECFSFSDTVLVNVNSAPPAISLPSQIVLCQGVIDTLDPGVSGVAYLWNDGTSDATLSISGPGTYSLTVSNACGADIDSVVVMDGGPQPIVSLGQDTVLCPGTSIDIVPVFSDVDSWLWQDGSSGNTFTVTNSGNTDISVANGCGVDYDTIFIALLPPAPVLNLGVDTALCVGLSITLSISATDVDILWSDGSTNQSLVINVPGTYFATISNECGADVDSMVLNGLPDIPNLYLGTDLPLCPGEVITIDPGITDVDYLWQDGSTDSFYLANSAQEISLVISNSCGTSTDSLTIYTSTDGPEVSLGPDILVCEGEVVTINANVSGVDYLWQDGSANDNFIATTSGTYFVQVSNSCGADSDTIDVEISGQVPFVQLGPDTTLCKGNTLTLVSNADGETNIKWQDGSSVSSYLVTMPGIYILNEENHCGQSIDTINIHFQPFPEDFELGADTTLCPGDSLVLYAPVTSDHFEWQDGSVDQDYVANDPGTYTLTVSNACGSKVDHITITYDNKMLQFPDEDEFLLCPGDVVDLDVEQAFSAQYSWSNGAVTSGITIITPGVYMVTVITDCQQADHQFDVVLKTDCEGPPEFFIPTVFSPNGDNVNELFGLWTIDQVEFISIDGSIFDRWGDLMFQSTNIPFTWDGKFGEKVVMPGVYVYTILATYKVNGQTIQERFNGDVTVIK